MPATLGVTTIDRHEADHRPAQRDHEQARTAPGLLRRALQLSTRPRSPDVRATSSEVNNSMAVARSPGSGSRSTRRSVLIGPGGHPSASRCPTRAAYRRPRNVHLRRRPQRQLFLELESPVTPHHSVRGLHNGHRLTDGSSRTRVVAIRRRASKSIKYVVGQRVSTTSRMRSLRRVRPSQMRWVLSPDVFDGERLRSRVGNPVVDTDELDDRGCRDSLQAVGGHPPRCSMHEDDDPPRAGAATPA